MILWFMRDLSGPITGFYFSNLDIRNVAEVLAFVGAGFTLLAASMQSQTLGRLTGVDALVVRRAALIIFAIGLGGHFGNYFYSAIAKLALDGGVFSWLFDNRLYDGAPGALERGTFPFALWPGVTQFTYDAMKALNLPLHLFSFAAQFAAIIAIFRRRWIVWLTVVYDIFHVIVYITFGLIFWKWIALNAIILATLSAVPDAWWTRSTQLAGAASVLAGAIFFKTATLAWYDSPGFMSVFFEAELESGERVRVPTTFFHSASYQVSQARFYAPPDKGSLQFRDLGLGPALRGPESGPRVQNPGTRRARAGTLRPLERGCGLCRRPARKSPSQGRPGRLLPGGPVYPPPHALALYQNGVLRRSPARH